MIESTRALVDLIDRFLDHPYRHSNELGGFVHRPSPVAHLETIRNRLLDYEELLEREELLARLRYYDLLLTERNSIAPLLGLSVRTP